MSFIEVSVRMLSNFSGLHSDHYPMKPVEIFTVL